MATATTNLGLTLTPASETETNFIVWRTAINGDGGDSNMQKIDAAIGELQAGKIAPATTSTMGGVIVGDHLAVDEDGKIAVDTTFVTEAIQEAVLQTWEASY